MFGPDYAQNFGLPTFPWTGIDSNPFYGPRFSGMDSSGQPAPGVPAPASFSANPSVAALTSGSPLAVPKTGGAFAGGGTTGSPLTSGGGSVLSKPDTPGFAGAGPGGPQWSNPGYGTQTGV